MMPYEIKRHIKDRILMSYVIEIDKCPSASEMVQPTISVIRALASEVLTDHYLYLSTTQNP